MSPDLTPNRRTDASPSDEANETDGVRASSALAPPLPDKRCVHTSVRRARPGHRPMTHDADHGSDGVRAPRRDAAGRQRSAVGSARDAPGSRTINHVGSSTSGSVIVSTTAKPKRW